MTEYAFEGLKQPNTQVTWSFETQTLSGDSSFAFSNPIASAYQSTILNAFTRWASVSGLSFTQVPDSSSVDIRIGWGVFSNGSEIGETDYRTGSAYFPPDVVVRLLDPATSPLTLNAAGLYAYSGGITLYQVILHELGHALGLAHTTDRATIMYPVATNTNQDLATGDIQGMNALYPLYTVKALDPIQTEGNSGATLYHFTVDRYSDPSTAVTLSYTVTPSAAPQVAGSVGATASRFVGGVLPSGQITFAAGVSELTVTIAVQGNTLSEPDAGFSLSLAGTSGASATERGTASALIVDDDNYTSIDGRTVGVFRFFSQIDGTHFFTDNQTERNMLLATRPDLVYEGVTMSAVADPNAAGAVPIFRFFDAAHGTHFYSDSSAERDTVQATRPDLLFEGTAFYEHATAQSGDAPVYRFFNQSDGTHFYTDSASERATLLATRPDLLNEGVAFYAPTPT